MQRKIYLLALVVLLPCTVSASAATIHVPGDQPTIQAGINSASSGDTVLVSDGSYSEAIDNLSKSLVIRSLNGPSTTIIYPPAGSRAVYLTGGGKTKLDGFTLCGPGKTTGTSAVGGGGVGVFEITNCRFNGFNNVIQIAAVTHVSRCLIHDYWGNAVVTVAESCEVVNNTIDDGERGIAILGQFSRVENNIIVNQTAYAIYNTGGAVVDYNDTWNPGSPLGTHGLSQNPLFYDAPLGDYTLQPTSPCVDTGDPAPQFNDPDGSRSDMGAFPFEPRPLVGRIAVGSHADSLHVVEDNPLMSWTYSDRQSRPHTKSEIEVGTDNDWTVAEMWWPPTILGSDTSIQYAGTPLTDGSSFCARVRVFNDTLWSSWLVTPFRMNSVPSTPTPLFPAPGSIVPTGRPSLVIMNAIDAENDALHYDFEVYRDSGLTMLAAYIAGVIEGPGQTGWKVDSLTAENQRHWWRARASDGHENGPWSPVWTFLVDAFNQPPAAFNLLTPTNGAAVYDLTPPFIWNAAIDPDPAASLNYTLVIGLNSNFIFKSEISDIADTTFHWSDSLENGRTYWWKVKADDGRGGTATSAVRSFKTTSLGDENADGVVDVFDVIMLIDYVFSGGPPPNPASVADVNGDCVADVFDIIYLIDHVFSGGPAPVPGCS